MRSCAVGLHLAALVAYRLLHAHTGNQNLRLIYPVVIAMAVLYAHALICTARVAGGGSSPAGCCSPSPSVASALFFAVDSRL